MHSLFAGVMPAQHVLALPRTDSDETALNDFLGISSAQIAAIVVEPSVQGAGGMVFHDGEVLARLRRLADRHNVLLIFDEIFTGFGRTGPLFVCDASGVTPDIITLSKALTGGTLPLSAAIASTRVSTRSGQTIRAPPSCTARLTWQTRWPAPLPTPRSTSFSSERGPKT